MRYISWCLILLLQGCLNDTQHLDALYFNDKYIETIIHAGKMAESGYHHPQLTQFFATNGTYFFPSLLEHLKILHQQPSTIDRHKLDLFSDALNQLHHDFPAVISDTLYNELVSLIQTLDIEADSISQDSVSILIHATHYRKALETLLRLEDHRNLDSNEIALKNALQAYLPRRLYMYPIHVHDKPTALLKNEPDSMHAQNYSKRGESLLYESINIPLDFQRHLVYHIAKEASSYLTTTPSKSTANYYIKCSVGFEKQAPLLQTRKDITDTFLVKFDEHSTWEPYPIEYEIYVQTTTYIASVDAAIYIQSTNELIRHVIFETRYPHETIELGQFINRNPDIIEMEFSDQYKAYKIPSIDQSQDHFVQHVLDDAANVLAIRILNTIDIEPELILESHPFIQPTLIETPQKTLR